MTQTRIVASKLAQYGIVTTILPVTTAGDREQQRSFEEIGTQNLFVTEIEVALREGRADYAVHSCKDLPSTLPADMTLAAVSAREDPRDAFCSERYERFESLPPGAVVGTSSPRRRAQLASLRPDLEYRTLRGNVDTRLKKLREGGYDAIVLANAGLRRLGVRAAHVVPFDVEQLVPAAGQGALAIETLSSHETARDRLREAINDESAEFAITCERAALASMRGGCLAPIGIHGFERDGAIVVLGAIGRDGGSVARECVSAPVSSPEQARALGASLAERLLCSN